MLNICSGVGSDILGGFYAGLNVVGVEIDVNQCKLAAQRIDANQDQQNRERVEDVLPMALFYEFFKKQKQMVIDIVQTQRDIAVEEYEEYRAGLTEKESENLQSTATVLAQEGPEEVNARYAVSQFKYPDIKDCVSEFLLPNLPSSRVFDSVMDQSYVQRLRKPTKSESSSRDTSEASASVEVADFKPSCQTCGDDVLKKDLGRCTACNCVLHKSGSDPQCFVLVDKQIRCRADCK
jgi:hypothetical protein